MNLYSITYTSIGGGDWSNNGTWDQGSPPADGDDVIVAHNVDLDVNSATISTLTISAGGRLRPTTADNTFTLNTSGDVTVDGDFEGSRTGGGTRVIDLIVHGNSTLTVAGTFNPTHVTISTVGNLTFAQSLSNANGLSGQEDFLIYGQLTTSTNSITTEAGGAVTFFSGSKLSTDVAGGVSSAITGAGTHTFDNATNYLFGSNVTAMGMASIPIVNNIELDQAKITSTNSIEIQGNITALSGGSDSNYFSDIGSGTTFTMSGSTGYTANTSMYIYLDYINVTGIIPNMCSIAIGEGMEVQSGASLIVSGGRNFTLNSGAYCYSDGVLNTYNMGFLGTNVTSGDISTGTVFGWNGVNHTSGTFTLTDASAPATGSGTISNLSLIGTAKTFDADLTITQDLNITTSWSASSGTVTMSGGNITGGGTLSLFDLKLNGNVTQISTDLTVTGDLDIGANSLDVGTNQLTLHGDILSDDTNGFIDAEEGTSTVEFTGSTAISVGATEFQNDSFGNLILTKSSTVTLQAASTVAGDLTLNNASAYLDQNGLAFNMFGNINYTAGVFGSNADFNKFGTLSYTFPDMFENQTINGFIVRNSGTVSFNSDLTTSYLEMSDAGAFIDMEDNTLTLTNNISISNGQVDLTDDNSTLVLTGAGTTLENDAYVLGQIGNLTVQRTTRTTLNDDLTIDGTLFLDNASATFDIDTYNLNIGGSLSYSAGTVDATDNSSTFSLSGSNFVTLDAAVLANDEVGTFYIGQSNQINLSDNLTVDGDIILDNASAYLDINSNTLTLNGDLIRNSGAVDAVPGAVSIGGSGGISIPNGFFDSNSIENWYLTHNGVVTLTNTLNIDNTFYLNNAGLDIDLETNGETLSISGIINYAAGTISVQTAGSVNMTSNSNDDIDVGLFDNNTIYNYEIGGNRTISMKENITIANSFDNADPNVILDIETNQLTIAGGYPDQSGEIDATDNASTVVIAGTGVLTLTDAFVNDELGNFTITRTGATTSNIGNLTVDGDLTLNNGGQVFDMVSSTLTINDQLIFTAGTIDLDDAGDALIVSNGVVTTTYDTDDFVNKTIYEAYYLNGVVLSNSHTYVNYLSVENGLANFGNNSVEVQGDFALDNSGSVSSGVSGTFIFSNSTDFTNNSNGTVFLTDVYVTGTLNTTVDKNISGDLNVSGVYSQSSGTATFLNSIQKTITNTGTTDFENVIIASGSDITTASSFDINADLELADNTSVFVATNPSNIVFTQSNANITTNSDSDGASTGLTFYDLSLSNVGNFYLNGAHIVYINGDYLANNGRLISEAGSEIIFTDPAGATAFGYLRGDNYTFESTATFTDFNIVIEMDGDLTVETGASILLNSFVYMNDTDNRIFNNAPNDYTNLRIARLDVNGVTTTADDLSIRNAFDVAASSTFSQTSGTINFEAFNPTVVTNGADSDMILNHVRVEDNPTSTADILINGNFLVVDGGDSWVSSDGSITFTAANLVIDNNGTLQFYDLEFDQAVTNGTTNDDITVANDLTMNGNANFIASDPSQFTFSGASNNITTTADADGSTLGLNLHDVSFTGDYTSVGSNTIQVSGDFDTNGGGYAGATNSTIYFSGSTGTITNGGTLDFYNIEVGSNATSTYFTGSGFDVQNNFHVEEDGIFYSTAGTVVFEGTSGTISSGSNNNADNITFEDIQITSTALESSASYSVNGDFVVGSSAALTSTAGAVHFRNGTSHQITNGGGLIFWDFVIDDLTGNIVNTSSNFIVDGDNFIVAGSSASFLASAGEVSFTGSSGTITNNANEDNLQFYDFETNSSGVIDLNEDDSFNISNDARIIGGSEFTCYGDSRVTFNGTQNQDLNIISSVANFRDLYLESGFELDLSTDIQLNELNIYDDLVLEDGRIDLNGDNIITMHFPDANLIEDPEENVIYNSNTNPSALGHIYYSENFTSRVASNNLYGLGLGIQQSLGANPMGNTIIKRYHANLEPAGGLSIRRYFEIDNDNTDIDASIVFNYFEEELNNIPEETMVMLSTQSIDDIWAVREYTAQAASDRYLQTDSVYQFTGFSRIFTLAEPVEFTLDSNFAGLTDTNDIRNRRLIAGQTDYQVFSFSLVADGNVQIDSLSIDLSDNSEGQLKNFRLVYSQNSIYDSTDVTQYAPTISSGDIQLSFIQTIDLSNAVTYYFYLLADVEDDVTIESPNVEFYINQSDVSSPNSIGVVREIQGPSFGFQQRIDAIFNPIGITQPTLYPEDENVVIYGFELQPLGNDASLSEFRLVFENDNINGFVGNIEVFKSTDDNYLSTDDNLQIDISSNVSLGELDYIDINFEDEQQIDVSGQYYFIKIDSVSTNADEDTPLLRPGIPQQSLISSEAAPVLTDTAFGIEYDFKAISAIIISSKNIPAKNIIAGISNQSIFGFTIETNQPTSLENITFDLVMVDLQISDISQLSIYEDINENGLPDSDELLDQIIPTTSRISFDELTESDFENSKEFLITASFKSTSEPGSTVYVQIQDASFVGLSAPAILDAGGPYTGNVQTIKEEQSPTQVNLEYIYPSTIISGDQLTLTLISRDSDGDIARLDGNEDITFNVNGTDVSISGVTNTQMQKDEYFETVTGVVLSSTDGESEAILQTNTTNFGIDRDTLIVFKSAPTSAPSNISFSDGSVPTSIISIDSWTNGNGDGRIIVARLGNTPIDPTNGVLYSAVTDFNNVGAVGTNQTDAGSVVIYNNSGNSFPFEITNLMAGQNYYFRIYEYNLTDGVPIYYVPNDIDTYVYQTTSADEAFSGNNDSTNAAVIPEDFAFEGQISTELEEDWYFYNLNEDFMQINMCIENKVVGLYYQQGNSLNLIRVQENFQDNCNYILLNNADHGKYYLRVYSADIENLPNEYSLKITSWTDELFSKTGCDCPK